MPQLYIDKSKMSIKKFTKSKFNIDTIEVGNRIKEIRTSKKLTIQGLSQETGLSLGLISEAESGKNKPSPNLLFALAKKYHINISWLLTGEGEKNLSEKHSFKVPDDLLELCEMAERWPEVKKVLLAELEKLKVYLADRFQDRYSADGAGEKPESKAG